jgi:hypothetical protein
MSGSIFVPAGPGGTFTPEQVAAQEAYSLQQAGQSTETYDNLSQQQIAAGVANIPTSTENTKTNSPIQYTATTPYGASNNPELGGGAAPAPSPITTPQVAGTNGPSPPAAPAPPSITLSPPPDLRVRLAALSPKDVYAGANQSGILGILAETGGLIYPYTPQIGFSQAVTYSDLQLVHSDTDYNAYTRTPAVNITVAGKFTVQNAREGRYALAAIHFFRTVSKSYFGEADAGLGKAGLPPPVLLFSGYGPYMYQNVRVILKSHSWAYDEAMDTVAVSIPQTAMQGVKTVRLPAMFTIQCELTVIQTPQRMRTVFSFDAFAKGDLLSDGWL